jgi:hypothetical protein
MAGVAASVDLEGDGPDRLAALGRRHTLDLVV